MRPSAGLRLNGMVTFEIECSGKFGFDGFVDYRIQVKSLRKVQVKDIRLEVPYTAYAAKYMMGLGHKGGLRPDTMICWKWTSTNIRTRYGWETSTRD